MKGSLDEPPIVIRGSRWKAALLTFGAALFVVIGSRMVRDPDGAARDQMFGWAGILFFGFCAVAGAWQVFRPTQLEISPRGLSITTPFRPKVYPRWADIGPFRVWSHRGAKMVVFDAVSEGGLLESVNSDLSGSNQALGGAWAIAPEDLARLLNEAKARWT